MDASACMDLARKHFGAMDFRGFSIHFGGLKLETGNPITPNMPVVSWDSFCSRMGFLSTRFLKLGGALCMSYC